PPPSARRDSKKPSPRRRHPPSRERNRLPTHPRRSTQSPRQPPPRTTEFPSPLPRRRARYPNKACALRLRARSQSDESTPASADSCPSATTRHDSSRPPNPPPPAPFLSRALPSQIPCNPHQPHHPARRTGASYLRKASLNPPSTGIMCPLVQRECGPAKNNIACAQSSGSIG